MGGKEGLTGGKRVERGSEKQTLFALVLGLLYSKEEFFDKNIRGQKTANPKTKSKPEEVRIQQRFRIRQIGLIEIRGKSNEN